jgi:hypothetical protein
VGVLFGLVFLTSSQAVAVSPVDVLAEQHKFSIASWEMANLPDKWIHKLFGNQDDLSSRARLKEAQQFFAFSDTRGADDKAVVEEIIEDAVAQTLLSEGLGEFPPVDVSFSPPPKLLVLSPRHKIERTFDMLLSPSIINSEREDLEQLILSRENQSAIVENTGGLAVYPSIVTDRAGLYNAFIITAHEWIHQWLFFKPLGRAFWDNNNMNTLNETVAEVAGKEIGRKAYGTFVFSKEMPIETSKKEIREFDFRSEMRITREHTEKLLAEDDINGAETYMEQRRRIFVAEGYPIRKLNQAYFAFHGTYGTSGASISPIGPLVEELRKCSASIEQFLNIASRFSDYEEFVTFVTGQRCS